jgi:ABC-2 type transport system ATP-binding protein
MMELKNLSKKFGEFTAVDQLNLSLRPGEVFGFLGPNGAGKTTTIKMATGLLRPDSGQVLIEGIDLALEPEKAKSRMGYVPDRPELFPYLSARETLQLCGGLFGLTPEAIALRGGELLKAFGLEAWVDERTGSFSHGMKQKLAFCCALLHRPSLLILDEPMVGLDPKGGRQVKELLRLLAKEGMTIFISIHTLEIAETLCDRLGILMNGRLLSLGTVEEIHHLAGGTRGPLEDAFLKLTGEGEALGLQEILKQVKP